MATLYMMIGAPGSGKSTWAKEHLPENGVTLVSRDNIRFKLLRNDPNYFSKEKEVFKHFPTGE